MKGVFNKGFTLIELIVVISILSILGTISFTSLQWFSENARDGVRVSDTNNIEKSLEIFFVKNGKYPTPDSYVNLAPDITDTENLRKQWTLWDDVMSEINRNLPKKPLDPSLESEYIYSISNNKEFQILALFEGDQYTFNNDVLLNKAYADSRVSNVKLFGNYNWVFLKWKNGGTNFILPIPSIINISDEVMSWTAGDQILLTQEIIESQAVEWINNIPNTSGILNSSTWKLDIMLSLYEYNTIKVDNTYTTSKDVKIEIMDAIKDAYSWSALANKWIYKVILTKESEDVKIAFSELLMWNGVKWNSCDSTNKPLDNWHITYINNADSMFQSYIKDWNKCWFSCNDWYRGDFCEKPPAIISKIDCGSVNWYWQEPANDMDIWTGKGEWFCISPKIWDIPGQFRRISWNGWGESWYSTGLWWNWNWKWDSWETEAHLEDWQTRFLAWGNENSDIVEYTCKPLWVAEEDFITEDNLLWRMKWLSDNKATHSALADIDWVNFWTFPAYGQYWDYLVPALFIADCIDWKKDLTNNISYINNLWIQENISYQDYTQNVSDPSVLDYWWKNNETYQKRQKYLLWWTQKSWSHLPSAFSNITIWNIWSWEGEYELACNQWILTDWIDKNVRLSALWWPSSSWEEWWFKAYIAKTDSCSNQGRIETWNTRWTTNYTVARFVIRP